MNVDRRMVALGCGLAALFLVDAAAVHFGWLRAPDHRFLGWLRKADRAHDLIGPAWDLKLAIGITNLGGASVRAPLTIAAALVLGLRHRGREAAMLAFAVAGGAIALPILKLLFDRARPDLYWHLVEESDWSFPSGHSMGAMILYPLLGYIAGTTRGPGRARLLGWLGVIAALIVGASRVVLGVHWASDVIGGWLIGGAVTLGAIGIFRKPVRRAPS